jgi:protein-S-isoprenylcysteine O-methyltransferase Ste14
MWFALALVAMFALRRFAPAATVVAPPWSRLGWALVAVGGALALAGVGAFRRATTPVKPFRPVTALVEAGPFRFTRNPMYLGLVLVSSGVAVLLGAATPLLVPPALWLLLDRRFVRREEAMLRSGFGAAYGDYCARVARWWGRPATRR